MIKVCKFFNNNEIFLSSLTLVWHVKCMSFQLSDFIQPSVTKDVLMDGWHVSKIYKHIINYLHMTKNQPSLTHVINIAKSYFNLT